MSEIQDVRITCGRLQSWILRLVAGGVSSRLDEINEVVRVGHICRGLIELPPVAFDVAISVRIGEQDREQRLGWRLPESSEIQLAVAIEVRENSRRLVVASKVYVFHDRAV